MVQTISKTSWQNVYISCTPSMYPKYTIVYDKRSIHPKILTLHYSLIYPSIHKIESPFLNKSEILLSFQRSIHRYKSISFTYPKIYPWCFVLVGRVEYIHPLEYGNLTLHLWRAIPKTRLNHDFLDFFYTWSIILEPRLNSTSWILQIWLDIHGQRLWKPPSWHQIVDFSETWSTILELHPPYWILVNLT